jgi:hypothetical protein
VSSGPTVVVANQTDQLQIHLSIAPAQQIKIGLAANIGSFGSTTTTPSGVADGIYTSGSLPSGGTSTVKVQLTAQACNGSIPSVTAPAIYNYNGFNVHQSVVSPPTFIDSNALDANGIQARFAAKNSFLASFVFVQYIGGFMDSNHNGKYDSGESAIGSISIGATGTSAASVIDSIAKSYRINPTILLATAQKEKGLLSASTLPSKTTLDWALGCGNPTDFRSQWECSARTFVNWFNTGKTLTYPYLVSGLSHNPGAGLVTGISVRVVNEATYTQYKYTPFIQDQPNGGGVYLFETIWSSIK